jgi:hypothetical protein
MSILSLFKMNKNIFTLLLIFLLSSTLFAQKKEPLSKGHLRWKQDPFSQKVFGENKGQFDSIQGQLQSPVLFGLRDAGYEVYFSAKGLGIRRLMPVKKGSYNKEPEDEKEEEERKHAIQIDSFSIAWINANPNVKITGEDMVSNYFTYGDPKDKSGQTAIKANAFKRITYKELYPGIDVVYSFPKDKDGFEYSIILHPGADISLVRMDYSKSPKLHLDKLGNLLITSPFGDIIDHAPVTFDDSQHLISSAFSIKDKEVSFVLARNYDHSKTLIVDPWTVLPPYTNGSNKAYDIDADNQGNVYVYGGNYLWQETKISPSGTILWTYTVNSFSSMYHNYGDFALDMKSGSSYIVEGFRSSGARVLKVDAAGLQQKISPGNATMNEMWRIRINKCTGNGVIGGGGTGNNYQACILDTTLTVENPINILSTSDAYHDIALLALDDNNNIYACPSSCPVDATFNNTMLKLPFPALSPLYFNVPSNYQFVESNNENYNLNVNGFNGMAVNSNFFYTYDGFMMDKWDAVTGAHLKGISNISNRLSTAGIDLDVCGNVFIGADSVVREYDVNLNLINSFAFAGTIYDLKVVGPDLYVCGKGFVASFDLGNNACQNLNSIISATSLCSSGNVATISASGGTAPYQYSWHTNPPQTGDTAKGLSPGTYLVTVKDNSCTFKYAVDTVKISAPGEPNLTPTKDTAICKGDSVKFQASGAASYTWSPSIGLNSTNISNPSASPASTTTYTVTGNLSGCPGNKTVTVKVDSLVLTLSAKRTCGTNGSGIAKAIIGSGSIAPYSYSWSPISSSQSQLSSLNGGTYTCTVKAADGCIASTMRLNRTPQGRKNEVDITDFNFFIIYQMDVLP